jgi:hypothetical protein
MSANPIDRTITVPHTLQQQLRAYRQRLWRQKLAESAAIVLSVIAAAYLTVYLLDRLGDTPAWVRAGALLLVLAGCGLLPWYAYRWVYCQRRPTQLARLIQRRRAALGDRLLGAFELSENRQEQARSPALCEAALAQVAKTTRLDDLWQALPATGHRRWAVLAAALLVSVTALGAAYPDAAARGWARLLLPLGDVPRYTFTQVERLPERLVVPHGEAFAITAALSSQSQWRPESGEAQLARLTPVASRLSNDSYPFQLPPQLDAGSLRLKIGDFLHNMEIAPTLRPELAALSAEITLPAYLEQPQPRQRDARSGSLAVLRGSSLTLQPKINRALATASLDGRPLTVEGDHFRTDAVPLDAPRELTFKWEDEFGLGPRQPFTLKLDLLDDEPPTVAAEGLPRQAVVLVSEQLVFHVRASDDYGIRKVGIQWQGAASPLLETPAQGERVLAAGGPTADQMSVEGVFCAAKLDIEPQLVAVRVWVEDYFPDRPRTFSAPFELYVLSPDQHAIWITEQLNKWHRQALEVRDRELQLHETNRELLAMDASKLDQAQNRKRLEDQAAAERANGRRLSSLASNGEELVRQAARNEEIGVGHLDRWAEMLQVLKDISANRMPSVAAQIKQAAEAQQSAAAPPPKPAGPMAGQSRDSQGAPSGKPPQDPPPSATEKPPVPQLVDRESSQQPPAEQGEDSPPPKPSNSAGRLTLPSTTLTGPASKKPPEGEDPSAAQQNLEQAVREQADLLAEFEKITDELNQVLANMEGSTLVKRLKAAAREQYDIATRLTKQLSSLFGIEKISDPGRREFLTSLANVETDSHRTVSYIMDDIDAYFERRRMVRFKEVLDDMRTMDVLGGLRNLSEEIPKDQGLSIAGCEYWSDALDRWAEDLVDPAQAGTCPGGKSRDSLPPSIILEVLRILEGEINLREETRVAQQARPALDAADHTQNAHALSRNQLALEERVADVVTRIEELPEASEHFGQELRLLAAVQVAMDEAAALLGDGDTGAPAMAAETEAIELLLQSRRINPRGGGGGGSSPGGGGGGTTSDSALALLGKGVNDREVREDRSPPQTTGQATTVLPAEYRAGLDTYFNQLESLRSQSGWTPSRGEQD